MAVCGVVSILPRSGFTQHIRFDMNEYCNIMEHGKVVHFGELIELGETNIEFIDYITSEVVEYNMGCECTITFESKERHDNLNQIKGDKKITSSDFKIIFESEDPMSEYKIIRSLRDLGFLSESSINSINILRFKRVVSRVIMSDLEGQLAEVRNDSDLSDDERGQLIDICKNTHRVFEGVIQSATSIKDILERWPNILLVDKPHLYYLINQLD